MSYLPLSNYNLNWTLLGGQDFNWQETDDGFLGVFQNFAIKIKPSSDGIYWQTYPDKDNFELLRNYLVLDENQEEVVRQLRQDSTVDKAINSFPNLRILSQNFEQTVINFIMSSNNNLPSIRDSIRALSDKFGENLDLDGQIIQLYPQISKIAELSIEELRSIKVGYRAKYIKETARILAKFPQLAEDLIKMNRKDAKDELIELPGVGPKVADCILVFSLGFRDITPIDRWGFRIHSELYGNKPSQNYNYVSEWFTDKFGENTAYAGQYLFEYVRNYKSI